LRRFGGVLRLIRLVRAETTIIQQTIEGRLSNHEQSSVTGWESTNRNRSELNEVGKIYNESVGEGMNRLGHLGSEIGSLNGSGEPRKTNGRGLSRTAGVPAAYVFS
jgi:hypothetical protein